MDPNQVDQTMLPVTIDQGIIGGLGIFAVFFVLAGIFILLIVVFMIFSIVRRYRAAQQAGLDPFAGDIQVMGQVKNSALLAPERSVADRLAEVDQLHAAGTISADELARPGTPSRRSPRTLGDREHP